MNARTAEIMADKYRAIAADFRRYPALAALAEKAERYAAEIIAAAINK